MLTKFHPINIIVTTLLVVSPATHAAYVSDLTWTFQGILNGSYIPNQNINTGDVYQLTYKLTNAPIALYHQTTDPNYTYESIYGNLSSPTSLSVDFRDITTGWTLLWNAPNSVFYNFTVRTNLSSTTGIYENQIRAYVDAYNTTGGFFLTDSSITNYLPNQSYPSLSDNQAAPYPTLSNYVTSMSIRDQNSTSSPFYTTGNISSVESANIPEPTTITLLAAGLIGFAATRKKVGQA